MAFLVFILGLCFGSFLNVVVDRYPTKKPMLTGRSMCDDCQRVLHWYDLIPLFSFIQIRGKCRYCKAVLSYMYPGIELLTGMAFLFVYYFFSPSLTVASLALLLYGFFLVVVLLIVFFSDVKFGIIPDPVVAIAVSVTMVYRIVFSPETVLLALLAAGGAGLFFFLLYFFTRGRGMGFGDVKYAVWMGLLLSFPGIILGLYLAFLTGALFSLILILWRKKRFFGSTIPFGPFLVLGTAISYFGEAVILQYVRAFLNI